MILTENIVYEIVSEVTKVPIEQRIEFYWNTEVNDNTLEKECKKWIDKGYIIHQIIPYRDTSRPCYYLLLYKF